MALHRWLTARAAGTAAPRRRLAVLARALATDATSGTATPLPPYRVLFFGTDDVSLATLRCLHANSLESDPTKRVVREIAVVCPSDRKVGGGRGKAEGFSPVPVKKFALKHGLEIIQTPPHVKSLKQWRPEALAAPGRFDVGVVVSFGYFLHPHLLEHLPLGAINMHPSLLPKYRGPAPIHHALLNGDDATGISIIEIDPRAFDVGRVLLQERVAIPRGTTWAPLAKQLAEEGGRCVVETLRELDQRKRSATVQDDALASHAPKLKLQDGFLELTETAEAIYHRWQALSDSVGVTVRFKDKDVKLVELRCPTEQELAAVREEEARVSASLGLTAFAPGAFFFDKSLQALWLKCAPASNGTADRAWLLVTKLQQADRKVGAAIDFANGYRLKRALQQFERATDPADADADAP